MRRYVREFIKDEINAIKQWEHKEPQKGNIEELKKILKSYERGYITAFEAVASVVDMHRREA